MVTGDSRKVGETGGWPPRRDDAGAWPDRGMTAGPAWGQDTGSPWTDEPDWWPEPGPDADGTRPTGPMAERPFYRGVARVPHLTPPPEGDTGEVPPDLLGPRPPARVAGQRWQTLRRGGKFTVVGLWFLIGSWAAWVAATGGTDLVRRALALLLVLATGALVFAVSRLLGRVVLEETLGRPRPSAWPSHLATFFLLVTGGISFLQQTWWVSQAWDWVAGR